MIAPHSDLVFNGVVGPIVAAVVVAVLSQMVDEYYKHWGKK